MTLKNSKETGDLMESSTDNLQPANDAGTHMADSHEAPFRLRSYQTEMIEESMQSNIICVMDTGSGKTHMWVPHRRWLPRFRTRLTSQSY